MVFRRKGRQIFEANVPNGRGGWKRKSTETKDRITAKKFQRMIDELGREGTRDWELLGAVYNDTISLAHLFDRWGRQELDQLRAELNDVDLAAYIPDWQTWLAPRVAPDTAAHYLTHVRTLIPKGTSFLRSRFTTAAIATWITTQSGRRTGTVRKYHASLSSFAGYLVLRGVLDANPLRSIRPPRAGKPRDRHVDTTKALAIAKAHVGPLRALSALLAGTGIEVTVALNLTKSDVDISSKSVRARGTKTYNRDRVVRVAEWAWPLVAEHIRHLTPAAPLFPGITRWAVGKAHRAVVASKAIGEKGYTARDARHTYAVRAARAGTPPQVIARQLGHKDATLVLKVYGVYFPNAVEREHWEKQADERDRQREAAK